MYELLGYKKVNYKKADGTEVIGTIVYLGSTAEGVTGVQTQNIWLGKNAIIPELEINMLYDIIPVLKSDGSMSVGGLRIAD